MPAQDRHQIGQHGGEVELFEQRAAIAVDERVNVLYQFGFVRHVLASPVKQHIGHLSGLILEHTQKQAQQLVAALFGEVANHSEIDEGDPVIL